jgi:hypothetical protein
MDKIANLQTSEEKEELKKKLENLLNQSREAEANFQKELKMENDNHERQLAEMKKLTEELEWQLKDSQRKEEDNKKLIQEKEAANRGLIQQQEKHSKLIQEREEKNMKLIKERDKENRKLMKEKEKETKDIQRKLQKERARLQENQNRQKKGVIFCFAIVLLLAFGLNEKLNQKDDDCELKIHEEKAKEAGRFECQIQDMNKKQEKEMKLFQQQTEEETRKRIQQVKEDCESRIKKEETKLTMEVVKFQQQIEELKHKQKEKAIQKEEETRKMIQQFKDDYELKIQANKTFLAAQVRKR